ncbi:MAG TPA: ThuA domain-containing protein [Tepidisphaeraceae bacterium]|nr:ThuA domain-containing protein [Tepidisphaeraceae bacterium]
MQIGTNRRRALKLTGLAVALLAFAPLFARAADAPATAEAAGPRKKVLFFTKSSGFQHSVITRSQEDPQKLAYAEQILTDLGAKHGFDVTCSKDGTIFSAENLQKFDVFAFYTTGDLTKDSDKHGTRKDENGRNVRDPDKLLHKEPAMPPGAKEAFLEAIRNGKGFIGFHSASDTFHSPAHSRGPELLRNVDEKGQDAFDPYIAMLGGEFIVHGRQQPAAHKVIDGQFPGAAAFEGARFTEEWYALKNFAPDLHVILAQDTTGMTGGMYERPFYPATWARMHGKGRVFYTSLGHREDVWQKPEFIGLVTGALNWTSGRIEADVTPNLKQATPDADRKTAGATTQAAK